MKTLTLRGYAGRFPASGNWKKIIPALRWTAGRCGAGRADDRHCVADGSLVVGRCADCADAGRRWVCSSARRAARHARTGSPAVTRRAKCRPPLPSGKSRPIHVEDEDEPFDHVHPEAMGSKSSRTSSCVRHTYADSTTVSLCGLDFVVTAAQRVVIPRPQRIGQVHAAVSLAGLLRPTKGWCDCFDHDPAQHWSAVRERVGVVLQNVDEQILAPTAL